MSSPDRCPIVDSAGRCLGDVFAGRCAIHGDITDAFVLHRRTGKLVDALVMRYAPEIVAAESREEE